MFTQTSVITTIGGEALPQSTWKPLKKTRWSPQTRMQTRSKSYICPNDTLVGHSCETLFWDTLLGHSCGTLLYETLVGHSCRTLLWNTLTGHSCGTLL